MGFMSVITFLLAFLRKSWKACFLTYFGCAEFEKNPFQAEFCDLGGQKSKSKWPPVYFNVFNYAVP